MKTKSGALKFGILGLGIGAIAYVLLKSRSAKAQTSFFSQRTLRGTKTPTLREIQDLDYLADPNSRVPSMAMVYDPSKEDMDVYEINFTPRRASTAHSEQEHNDLSIMDDPFDFPQEFRFVSNKDHMIHPNDYLILQNLGIIPAGFPIERTQYVTSPNGANEFLVGYSDEYTEHSKENAGSFSAIKPLWVVSFGRNFDSRSTPLNLGDPALRADFLDAGNRMMHAEWITSNPNGIDGCVPGFGKVLCDLERLTTLSVLLERRKIRQAKKKNNPTYENIAFESTKEAWNRGSTYLRGYNGHLGSGDPAHNLASSRVDIPAESTNRFNEFENKRFWHMPKVGADSTHFFHYKSLKTVPNFITESHPARDAEPGFAQNRRVRIGAAAYANHGRYFR